MAKLKDTIAEVRAREQEEGRLSVKEYISYAVSNFGFGSLGVMSGGYLLQFYAAIGIAVDKAGAVIAASRVWDLVNDPIIATIIDRGKTGGPGRRGKFTRWLAPLVPFYTVAAILMFINPPVGGVSAKIAVCFAAYFIYEIFSTFAGVSFQSMQAVMSPLLDERSNYITFGNLGDKLKGALPGLIPVAFDLLTKGGGARAPMLRESTFYTLCAVFFCGIGGAAAMFSKNLKERVFAPKQGQRLLDNFATFFKNKYYLLLWTANLANLISAVGWTAAPFYYMHSVGNYGVQTLVWTVTGIPTFLVMLLSPLFLKRFAPRRVVIFNKLLSAGCQIAMYFACGAAGYASPLGIALLIGFFLISSIPGGVADVANNICNINTFDYTEWETGERAEATTFVVGGMLNKGVNSLGPLIAGVLLARAGFESGENVVFSQFTKDRMFLYYTVFPAVGTLLSAIPYFFYKLEGPLLDKVQADLAERRKLTLPDRNESPSLIPYSP